jgi:hypothetical protein
MARIINTASGRKKAVNGLRKFAQHPAADLSAKLPRALPMTIANRVRTFFKDNYEDQQGWSDPNHTTRYADKKDYFLAHGAFWRIGSFGWQPQVHGSDEFGFRTGTLFDNISKDSGTRIITMTTQTARSNKVNIGVALNTPNWDGGESLRYTNDKGRRISVDDWGTENALAAFSSRITPAGHSGSVLTSLTTQQRNSLGKYLRLQFDKAFKVIKEQYFYV